VTGVVVYRSPKVADMYLFVNEGEALSRVPAALLARFGTPVQVLEFVLDAQRKLSRSDPAMVRAALASAGFYLQLPPAVEAKSRADAS
jgi:uncharacterized protein YcgL (UPF0745 family)